MHKFGSFIEPLLFEIVVPNQNAKVMKFGELYTDCVPPLSELLVRYKANLKNVVDVVSIREDDVLSSTNCQTNLRISRIGLTLNKMSVFNECLLRFGQL